MRTNVISEKEAYQLALNNHQKASELMGKIREIDSQSTEEEYKRMVNEADNLINNMFKLAKEIGGAKQEYLEFQALMLRNKEGDYDKAVALYKQSLLKETFLYDTDINADVLSKLAFSDWLEVIRYPQIQRLDLDPQKLYQVGIDAWMKENDDEPREEGKKERVIAVLALYSAMIQSRDAYTSVILNYLTQLMEVPYAQESRKELAEKYPDKYKEALLEVAQFSRTNGLLSQKKIMLGQYDHEMFERLEENDPLLVDIHIDRTSHPVIAASKFIEILIANGQIEKLSLDATVIDALEDNETFCKEYLAKNNTLTTLVWSVDRPDDETSNFLFQALAQNQTLTELRLNGFNFKDIPEASTALKANTTLKKLFFYHCFNYMGDDDAEAMKDFANGLAKNKGIEALTFKDMLSSDSLKFLCKALTENQSVTQLNISTILGGYKYLAAMLAKNKVLQVLNLRSLQGINDQQLESIANSLSTNTYLSDLKIGFSNNSTITENGLANFFKILQTNQNLKSIEFAGSHQITGKACTALIEFLRKHPTLDTFKIDRSIIDKLYLPDFDATLAAKNPPQKKEEFVSPPQKKEEFVVNANPSKKPPFIESEIFKIRLEIERISKTSDFPKDALSQNKMNALNELFIICKESESSDLLNKIEAWKKTKSSDKTKTNYELLCTRRGHGISSFFASLFHVKTSSQVFIDHFVKGLQEESVAGLKRAQ